MLDAATIEALVKAHAPDHSGHRQQEAAKVRDSIDLACSCGVALSISGIEVVHVASALGKADPPDAEPEPEPRPKRGR